VKRLTIFLITLIATVAATLFAKGDPGYVMIGYGHWSVELSLALLVILLIIGFTALYFITRLLVGLRHVPERTRNWNVHRKRINAAHALSNGLVQLVEGRWREAEKTLTKHIQFSETPLLNYLAAARAAQEQGAYDQRDKYLMLAHQSMPEADIAVGLSQAELQIRHGQFEQALASLEHLRQIAPEHTHVLKLLVWLYSRLEDWKNLLDILPKLRKRKVLDNTYIDQLESRCYLELLRYSAVAEGVDKLIDEWHRIPVEKRLNRTLLIEYCRLLINKGHSSPAEPLLREMLTKNWDSDLVYLYGVVTGTDIGRQLSHAESWLHSHENDPMLLLTIGRLCLRNHLWGKARQYLEASVNLGGHAEAYSELARLLEQLGEKEKALENYRKSLTAAKHFPTIELPKLEMNELETQAQQRLSVAAP
jgi:HemY protein